MRLAFFPSLAAAALTWACGRTTLSGSSVSESAGSSPGAAGSQAGVPGAGGASSGGGGGAGGSAGSAGIATFCPGAGWSSPSRAVAVGFSGADVVVISADGSRRVTATLGAAGIADSDVTKGTAVTSDGTLAWAQWSANARPEPSDGETVLLDRGGNVIWRLPGVVRDTWATPPPASRAGMVVATESHTQLVAADGTTSTLPLGEIQSFHVIGNEVQRNGWLTAMWATAVEGEDDAPHYGFFNLDGRPPQALAATPAAAGNVGNYEEQAYYLANPSALSLYLETSTQLRSIALGITSSAANSSFARRSASRIVVMVDQRLARIVEPSSGTVTVVNNAAIDAILGPDALGNPPWHNVTITSDSDFVLGQDDTPRYLTPRFLLDTRSGSVAPVLLDRVAPLRTLDGAYCGDTLALDDGRLGLGLRDAALAGFYVGKPDGSGFERVGVPFRNVTAIAASRIANTWLLRGVSGINTFCPPYEPFAALLPDAMPLDGDALQIVAPGAPPLVLPQQQRLVTLDATGLCALATTSLDGPTGPIFGATRVYDITSGTSTELDDLTNVTWL